MGSDPGPMVRRYQLGAALRQLRIDAGMTMKHVADELQVHSAKISRLENAQRNISVPDVLALLNLYGVTEPETRDRLIRLARQNRESGWWKEFDLEPPLEKYVGLEGAASKISDYQLLVPGLLQTRGYTSAIIDGFAKFEPATKKKKLDLREMRQDALRADTILDVIVDEAAVRRIVGGVDVMRAQIDYLIQSATSSRVSNFQIMPFGKGAHPGVMSGFTVLQFDAPPGRDDYRMQDVVFIEGISSDVYLEQPEDVSAHLSAFEALRSRALKSAESIRFLKTVHRELT
ncbi:helix-turn-helix domain-containing protein [Jidongwangia harbinensis]|uniref:helix-turn-helix domain-containing protein n=1 Tax=Jidongwangia harbinensis TaxID=2878561 RepID=UPI001CD91D4C|nr:helix-turn-helix transcriptional regulator [Jidongwangia harbinensis]MCA2213385.1 helix-turn-helix domain-containing protein [Jidongwangia harbinensis]